MALFALKAAFGAVPTGAAPIEAVMPDFTGNFEDAETATLPPTMLEMTGVITPNVQLIPTWAVSPISGVPFPLASVKVGAGTVRTPATNGRLQFDATASPMISFWY